MIDVVALDFDGILTGATVTLVPLAPPHVSSFDPLAPRFDTADVAECVTVSRRDGHGIAMLKEAGIEVIVVTREPNPLAAIARCRKLGIEIAHGVKDKAAFLRERYGDRLDRVCFAGDDLPDVEAMTIVGFAACPSDAVDEVKAVARRELPQRGGEHFVRALAELILRDRARRITPLVVRP